MERQPVAVDLQAELVHLVCINSCKLQYELLCTRDYIVSMIRTVSVRFSTKACHWRSDQKREGDPNGCPAAFCIGFRESNLSVADVQAEKYESCPGVGGRIGVMWFKRNLLNRNEFPARPLRRVSMNYYTQTISKATLILYKTFEDSSLQSWALLVLIYLDLFIFHAAKVISAWISGLFWPSRYKVTANWLL